MRLLKTLRKYLDDREIKRLNKELYDKEGELSRIKSLWEKEKIISGEFEKKFKKLNDMFKGVK